MKKYFKIWLLLLLIVPTICMFTACGGNKAKPEAISISNLTTFAWGEEFDYSDVETVLEMSDGKDKTISISEISVDSSSYKQYEAGTYPIIFSYKKDNSINVTVNVTVSERTFASPAASISGAKTEYLVGEALDLSVGTITVFYNEEDQQGKKEVQVALNDSKVTIDKSLFNNSAIASNQEIKATYLGKTASFFVNIIGEIKNVSSKNWTGKYDGSAHSILVESEGTTITYSTTENGTYSATNPSFTNVGEYDVYYKVSKEGYKTVTGVQTVSIEKATNSFTTTPSITDWDFGTTASTPAGAAAFGNVVFEYKLASALDSTYTTTVPTAAGDYVFRASVADTTNYAGLSTTIEFSINPLGELVCNVTNYSGEYDGEEHSATITCETAGSTITYATTQNGTYSATNPSYTDVCVNTIYYKIEKDGYISVSGSASITITKVTNSFITVPGIADWNYGEPAYVPVGAAAFGNVVFEYKLASALDSTYTTTIPTAIGDYVFRASVADTTNYTGLSIAFGFSINPLGELVGNVTNYSGEYDGEEHSATITCETAGSTITYATTQNGTYSATNPSYTDVCANTIYYKIEKDGYISASGSASITITKVTNSFTTSPNITSWNYGEPAYVPVGAAAFGNVVFEYKLASALDSTYTTTIPTAIGDYVFRASVADTTNYTGLLTTIEFSIDSLGELVGNVTNYSGEYDGEEHSATITCETAGSTITYATTENGTYSATNPSYTEIGNYTVYYKIEKDGYISASGSVTISITKKINAFTTAPSIASWAYGQTANAPQGVAKYGEIVFEYKLADALDSTYTTTAPTEYGSYILRATVEETAAYTGLSTTVPFAVTGYLDIDFTVNNYSGEYDGELHAATVSSSIEGVSIVYSLEEDGDYTSEIYSYENVGTYLVYYQISKVGYKQASGSVSINITKANNEFTVNPTVEDWTYGQVPNTPVATAKFGTPVFEYKVKDALDSTYTTTVPYQLGDYQIRAKVAGTDNYTSAEAGTVGEFSITPKGVITFEVNNYEDYFDGMEHSIYVNYTPNDAVITYSSTENGFYTSNSIEYTDSGTYTVYFKIQLAGYVTKTGSGTIKINKNVIEEPTVFGEYIYNGDSIECNFDDISYLISMGNESVERATEVGTYEVVFIINDLDNSEWAIGSDGRVFWKIGKADNSWIQELSIENWEVSSEASNPIATAEFGEVVFSYRTKDGSEYTNVKPESVGEYFVKASVEGTSNYNELSNEIAFEIEKSTPIITNPGIIEAKYGDLITSVIIPNEGLDGYWLWEDDNITFGVIGCQAYMANYVPNNTTLYKSITNYPIYINVKAEEMNNFSSLDITEYCENGSYTGNEYTPYVTITGEDADGATITYSYDSNDMLASVSITDAGTYTIIYIISKENYNSYCGEMVLEIAKAESQIPADIEFECESIEYYVGSLIKDVSLNCNYSGDLTDGYFSWEDEEATILSGKNSYDILFTPYFDNYLPRTISVELTGIDIKADYVEILSSPEREFFYVDEEIDLTGLGLRVYFNNGDMEYISNLEEIGFEYDAFIIGEWQYIHFSYDDCETIDEYRFTIIERQNYATIYYESEEHSEEQVPINFENGEATLSVPDDKVISKIELPNSDYSLDYSNNKEVLDYGTNKTCDIEWDLQWQGYVVDTYTIHLSYSNPDIDFHIGNKKAVLEDGKYVLDGVIASNVVDLQYNDSFYNWEGIYINGKLNGYSEDYVLALGRNEIKLCYSTGYGLFDFDLVITTKELPLKTITVGNELTVVDGLYNYLTIGATYQSYVKVYYTIAEGYEVVLDYNGQRKYFESGNFIQYKNVVDSQFQTLLVYETGGYAAYLKALSEGNDDELYIQVVDITIVDNPGVKELTIITTGEEITLFDFTNASNRIHEEIVDIEVELFQAFEGEFSYDIYLNDVLYDSENPLNRVYYYGYNSINVVVYLDGEEYNYLSYSFYYQYSNSLTLSFGMSPFFQENDSFDVTGIENGTKIYKGSTLLFEATEDNSMYRIESIPMGENTYTFVFTNENGVVKCDLIIFNTSTSSYMNFRDELFGYSLSINGENFPINYDGSKYFEKPFDLNSLEIELIDFENAVIPDADFEISAKEIRKNVYLLRIDYTYSFNCYVYYLYIYTLPQFENENTSTDFYYVDADKNINPINFNEDGEAHLEVYGEELLICNPKNSGVNISYSGTGLLTKEYDSSILYFTPEAGEYSVTFTIVSTDGSASATYTIYFTVSEQKVFSLIVDEENREKDLVLFTSDGENFSGDFTVTMNKSGTYIFSATDDYADYTFYDEDGNAWVSGQKYVMISTEDIITSDDNCLFIELTSLPVGKNRVLIPVNEDNVLYYHFYYQTEYIGIVEVFVYLITPEDNIGDYSIVLSDTSSNELEYNFRIANGNVGLDYQFEKNTIGSVYFTPDEVYSVMSVYGFSNPFVTTSDSDIIGYLKDGKIYYAFITFEGMEGFTFMIDDNNNVYTLEGDTFVPIGTLDSVTKAFTPNPGIEAIPADTTYSYCTYAGQAVSYENGATINVNDIGNITYIRADEIDITNITADITCPSNVDVYIVTNNDYETVPYDSETYVFSCIEQEGASLFIVKFVVDEGLETETSFMVGIVFANQYD